MKASLVVPLGIGVVLAFIAGLASCGDKSHHEDDLSRPGTGLKQGRGCTVLAKVNGLPVCKEDYDQEIAVGRLGGSPRLVLDELLSLTLVLYECERLAGPGFCEGPEPMHVRAERFLRAMFPPHLVCGRVSRAEYLQAYERLALAGRVEPNPDDPVVRMKVENFVCEAKAKRARRRYVRSLRRTAHVQYVRLPWQDDVRAASSTGEGRHKRSHDRMRMQDVE